MQHDDEDAKYAALTTLIVELRRSYQQLKDNYADLEATNANLIDANKNNEATIAELRAKTVETTAGEADHTVFLDTLQDSIDAFRAELQAKIPSQTVTETTLDTAPAAHEKLGALDTLQAAHEELKIELDRQIRQGGAQAASLRSQLQAMTTEAADRKTALAATKTSLDTLQAVHDELKAELLATKTSLTDSTAQLNTCQDELQAMTTEAAGETTAHTATKASLDTLQAAHDELKAELLATETSLTDSTAQLNTCQDELQAKTSEAADETTAHTATKASLAASQATVAKYRADMFEEATVNRITDISNMKKEVERNMTASGLHSLGYKMTKYETVTINGIAHTQKDCYIKALEINSQYAHSFYNLGNGLTIDVTVTVNGITYTKKGCYLKALEIDPMFKRAWRNLGNMMTPTSGPVTINGIAYTKEECLAKGQ